MKNQVSGIFSKFVVGGNRSISNKRIPTGNRAGSFGPDPHFVHFLSNGELNVERGRENGAKWNKKLRRKANGGKNRAYL